MSNRYFIIPKDDQEEEKPNVSNKYFIIPKDDTEEEPELVQGKYFQIPRTERTAQQTQRPAPAPRQERVTEMEPAHPYPGQVVRFRLRGL